MQDNPSLAFSTSRSKAQLLRRYFADMRPWGHPISAKPAAEVKAELGCSMYPESAGPVTVKSGSPEFCGNSHSKDGHYFCSATKLAAPFSRTGMTLRTQRARRGDSG